MLSRVGVHQLHSNAKPVSRLSQAALQEVADAKFVADSANDNRLGEIVAVNFRAYLEIRKSRHPGDDLFGQPFSESRNLRITAELNGSAAVQNPSSAEGCLDDRRLVILFLVASMNRVEEFARGLRAVAGISGQLRFNRPVILGGTFAIRNCSKGSSSDCFFWISSKVRPTKGVLPEIKYQSVLPE